jgi:death on curing protein
MNRGRDPEWLLPDVVLALQERMIAEFGGTPGLRDRVLLESALDWAKAKAAYGKPGLFDLAAAYAYGLGKNHPFHDGNKRVCLWAAVAFLELNGLQFHASEEDAVTMTLALVTNEVSESGFAAWLELCCQHSDQQN